MTSRRRQRHHEPPRRRAHPPVGGRATVEQLHGGANWRTSVNRLLPRLAKGQAYLIPTRRIHDRRFELPYNSRPQAHDDGGLGFYLHEGGGDHVGHERADGGSASTPVLALWSDWSSLAGDPTVTAVVP
jgi:hypothetical protein